ncbi:MAG: diguanylate cyclase, partial [Bdellovibrionales bacterium]|nr:diguanylate cyclase [Bdellovibrionales bacterium]
LVLLDVNMPGLSGVETLKRLRASTTEYVSVIFISGNSRTEDIVTGLDFGADDYVRKPYQISEVMARIRAHLRNKDIRDELLTANHKLLDMTEHDELTNLYNMKAFYARLDHELKRARRFEHSVGIIMFDVDHFKRVNDNHDHLFGSFVLKEVGRLIRKNIRNVDIGARYGGDEFVILLTETAPEGALMFAERLRKTIENTVFDSGHDKMQLTISLGVTVTDGRADLDRENLVRIADRALYEAKSSGRNCSRYLEG